MSAVKTPLLLVWVSGNELADETVRRITSLSITEREKKATDGSMVFSDPDFLISSSNIFHKGQRIAFLMGWVDEAIPKGPYIVKSYTLNASNDGSPKFTVEFQDYSHKMNKKKKKRKHVGKPVDVIKKIAEEHDLGYDIEDIEKLTFSDDYPLIQANQTDAAVLQKLAVRYGYVWGLEGTTLYFRRPVNFDQLEKQNDVPVLSYRINGATLMDFSANVKFIKNGKRKGSKQEADVVDVLKDSVEAVANTGLGLVRDLAKGELPDLSKLMSLDKNQEKGDEETEEEGSKKQDEKIEQRVNLDRLKGIFKDVYKKVDGLSSDKDDEASETNSDGTTDSEDEAKRKLAGALVKTTELIDASITPRLGSMLYRPGQAIIIAGVGERYSGKYHISEVTQSYGDTPSFRTTIGKATKRSFNPAKADNDAIAGKQDPNEANKVPGNQNSADGPPGKDTYLAVDLRRFVGKYTPPIRRVKKVNGVEE